MTRSRALRRDLWNSTADGGAYSFMVGVSETYFIPFALAIGMGDVAAGLAFTVPYLAGAALQLIGPWGVERLGSPRRWVIVTAAVQCASFVPMVAGAVVGTMPTWLLLLAFALYWGSAIGAGPAWSAWVAALFPSSLRANYFGRRNRVCQILTLVGLAIAGGLLTFGERAVDAAKASGERAEPSLLLLAFGVIFLMGSMGRGLSIQFLHRQSEPPQGSWTHSRVPLKTLLVRPLMGRERSLVVFLLAFQFAAQVSSPFVPSYLFREVGFSQWEYFLGAATLFATKSVASSLFGGLIATRGAPAVLRFGAILLTIHAVLFALPPSFALMMALMAMSGASWAAYELASFILLLERTDPRERTSVLTSLAFLNAVVLVIGSLLGGALLEALGVGRWGYVTIFLVSAAMRWGAITLLKRIPATHTLGDVRAMAPCVPVESEAGEPSLATRAPERVA